MRSLMMMLSILCLLSSAMTIKTLAAEMVSAAPLASTSGFTPSPDTPVIPWTKFSIQYAVRTVNNETPTAIVFYVTTDGGKTWQLLGEDPDKQSPMMVSVSGEGVYGFSTVIATQNRPPVPPSPNTRPDKFIIVHRTPPQITWISPRDEVKITNDGILLEWEVKSPYLGATPATIEYSTDGGNNWLPVRTGLPARGSLNWQLPMLAENDVMLRLIATDLAGNQRLANNRARFAVDRTPPALRILAPDSSGENEFDVFFEAIDNESGVASVDLYFTNDNGNSWHYSGPATQSPVRFAAPAGEVVGLYLVAADRRGNRTPAPQMGTPPMKVVTLERQPPQVTLLEPFNTVGTTLDANQPVTVAWNSRSNNPQDGNTIIEYSTDGGQTWYFLADKLPASGTWRWTPQIGETRGGLLRVAVANAHGNRGYATSQMFNVVSERPNTMITQVVGGETVPPVATPTDLSEIPGFDDIYGTEIMGGTEPLARSELIRDNDIENLITKVDPTKKTPPAPTKSHEPTPPAMTTEYGEIKDNNGLIIPIPTEIGLGANTPPVPPVDNNNGAIPPLPNENPENPPITAMNPSPTVPDIKKIESIDDILGGDLIPPTVENPTPPNEPGIIPPVPPIPTPNEEISKTPTGVTLPTRNAPIGVDIATLLKQAEMAANNPSGALAAEKLSREVIAKDPNNAAPYAILAKVYTEQGKLKEAADNATNACRLEPKNYNYLQVLGYAEYAYANSLFNKLRDGGIPENQQAATSEEMIKALNAAETAYRQLVAAPEMDKVKSAYFRLGQIEYFRGTKILSDDEKSLASIRNAIADYEKAREINEPEYREVLQIGICNYRLRDYDQAETALNRAIEIAGGEKVVPKEAYYYLASIHEKMARPQQALEYWEKVKQSYSPGNQYHDVAVKRIEEMKP